MEGVGGDDDDVKVGDVNSIRDAAGSSWVGVMVGLASGVRGEARRVALADRGTGMVLLSEEDSVRFSGKPGFLKTSEVGVADCIGFCSHVVVALGRTRTWTSIVFGGISGIGSCAECISASCLRLVRRDDSELFVFEGLVKDLSRESLSCEFFVTLDERTFRGGSSSLSYL